MPFSRIFYKILTGIPAEGFSIFRGIISEIHAKKSISSFSDSFKNSSKNVFFCSKITSRLPLESVQKTLVQKVLQEFLCTNRFRNSSKKFFKSISSNLSKNYSNKYFNIPLLI